MGTNDLVKELDAAHTETRLPVITALGLCMLAARAHGLAVVDGVYNAYKDDEGLAASCQQGKEMGFDGKTLIHPAQLASCNAIFTPSDDEIEWSRKIIAAFEQPENAGKGVITVEGQMVELLHANIAARTVAIAQAIENKQQAAA